VKKPGLMSFSTYNNSDAVSISFLSPYFSVPPGILRALKKNQAQTYRVYFTCARTRAYVALIIHSRCGRSQGRINHVFMEPRNMGRDDLFPSSLFLGRRKPYLRRSRAFACVFLRIRRASFIKSSRWLRNFTWTAMG